MTRNQAVLLLPCAALAFLFYGWGLARNPPGYFFDESAIAYTAYVLAGSGRDPMGTPLPLYPTVEGVTPMNGPYVYLLAGVFRLTGPGLMVPRWLSVGLGFGAALLLGWLARRMSGRLWIGAVVAGTALLTPWLLELSRLVFEVALYPLALALYLLALRRAQERGRWGWGDALRLGTALALLTYAYSIGRLLAPLLALGLVIFVGDAGWRGVLRAWLVYGIGLLPFAALMLLAPEVLTGRFDTLRVPAAEALGNYLRAFDPHAWLWVGDPLPRHHVPGMGGSFLLGAWLLALVGLAVVLRTRLGEPWWRYLLFALLVTPVPAALTTMEGLHALRLIPLPVLALVLTVPALQWLATTLARRRVLAALLLLTAAQGLAFGLWFHRHGEARGGFFEADFPPVFARALEASAGRGTVYVQDLPPGYVVHPILTAQWYATVWRFPSDSYARLPLRAPQPAGAIVVSPRPPCAQCEPIASGGKYFAYVTPSHPHPQNTLTPRITHPPASR